MAAVSAVASVWWFALVGWALAAVPPTVPGALSAMLLSVPRLLLHPRMGNIWQWEREQERELERGEALEEAPGERVGDAEAAAVAAAAAAAAAVTGANAAMGVVVVGCVAWVVDWVVVDCRGQVL